MAEDRLNHRVGPADDAGIVEVDDAVGHVLDDRADLLLLDREPAVPVRLEGNRALGDPRAHSRLRWADQGASWAR